MEVIKRKISLDDYTSRKKGTWGQITATTFNLNVFFTQDGDDMGIGTDVPFEIKSNSSVDYSELRDKLGVLGLASSFNFSSGTTVPITNVIPNSLFPNTRNPNKVLKDYYISGGPTTGLTEDKLNVVTSYDNANPYQIGIDVSKSSNIDYNGLPYDNTIIVKSNNNVNPIKYLIDGDKNENINLNNPKIKRGVFYVTTSAATRTVFSEQYGIADIPFTQMYYNSEGFNETTTREEYLFGITSTPTVFNDLFIDRGRAAVIQSHIQLGEIKNMSDLINYGNGFYNL